jgi:hypothetical protein
LFTVALNTARRAFSALRSAVNGDMEMNTQAIKPQAAENDLKQLMADVTRAMEKAQEAVAKLAAKAAAATAEPETSTNDRIAAAASRRISESTCCR